MTDSRDLSFWRNVAMISVAHFAVLFGLMRWGGEVKRRAPPDVLWLAGGATAPLPASAATAPEPQTTLVDVPAEPPPIPEVDEEETATLTPTATELPMTATPAPSATPRPAATAKPTAPPKAKPAAAPTPKSTPRATPKKTLLAKAAPKPSAAPLAKKEAEQDQSDSRNQTGSVSVTPAKGGAGSVEQGSGAAPPSQFNWYGNMLHDRFQGEWVQPKTAAATGSRMSTLVQLRIEKDGSVSDFRIVRSSGNVVVDESVAAVAKRVTRVDPPPAPLVASGHYDVRINFELNVE